MMKKKPLSDEDKALFRQQVSGARRLVQDKVVPQPVRASLTQPDKKRQLAEQANHYDYFSDEFHPHLPDEGPMRYLRNGVSHYELKKLRRGDYSPEMTLDVHGLTQRQAKQELGAMLAVCRRESLFCVSIMHGYGKHILKQKIPLWLAQHPLVMAFHQAPARFGGDAALLILLETSELNSHGFSATPEES